MKTIVAETVLLGREAFETLGPVEVIPDREIGPQHLAEADALVIRSKTKVTADLIAQSPVRFIGTATAGFEHMNIQSLNQRNIHWCSAPGCNADSVADYITAALLHCHCENGLDLDGRTLGIIGVGQVGSRVARRAEALGLHILLNDPPRADTEPSKPFHDLQTVLAQSDIVTLHVPLISGKPWPTLQMANAAFFKQMKPGALFMNAARGQVTDTDALLDALNCKKLSGAVLDVWEPEPNIRADILAAATLGTPHIAGHSLEGKLNGTIQVYREACRVFDREPTWDPAPLLPAVDTPLLDIDSRGKTDCEVLSRAVRAVYPILSDQMNEKEIPQFDRLRANYGIRREFKNTTVRLSENRAQLTTRLQMAGFNCIHKD